MSKVIQVIPWRGTLALLDDEGNIYLLSMDGEPEVRRIFAGDPEGRYHYDRPWH